MASTFARRALIINSFKDLLEANREKLGDFKGDVVFRYDRPGSVAERGKFPIMYVLPMMNEGDKTEWTNSPLLEHEFPVICLGYYKTRKDSYEADLMKVISYSDNCLDLLKPPRNSLQGGGMVIGSYQRLGSLVAGDFTVIWFINIFMVKAML